MNQEEGANGTCYAILEDGTIEYPISYAKASIDGFVSEIDGNGKIRDVGIVALADNEKEAIGKLHDYLKTKGATS